MKELKYKVSLNAAITAYKMTKFELAIKYANLCDKELGEKNDKAEKIRQVSLKYLKFLALSLLVIIMFLKDKQYQSLQEFIQALLEQQTESLLFLMKQLKLRT